MMKSLENGRDIEKYLNVDEVLKYFAVNTFLVNLDSYSGECIIIIIFTKIMEFVRYFHGT